MDFFSIIGGGAVLTLARAREPAAMTASERARVFIFRTLEFEEASRRRPKLGHLLALNIPVRDDLQDFLSLTSGRVFAPLQIQKLRSTSSKSFGICL